MAQLPEDGYRVVHYKAPLSVLDVFGAVKSNTSTRGQWQALLELSTPRAYYLSTSLPALAGLAIQTQ